MKLTRSTPSLAGMMLNHVVDLGSARAETGAPNVNVELRCASSSFALTRYGETGRLHPRRALPPRHSDATAGNQGHNEGSRHTGFSDG